MRSMIRGLYWVVTTQLGLNPQDTFRGARAIPAFISDYRKFRRSYSGRMEMMPFLHDRAQHAGDANSEYFLQDLHVAKRIYDIKPSHHVDVGSRIDGFVAHVASFRTIEVFDIRPLPAEVPGIVFRQADLMDAANLPSDYCDSLSCLHALEHFGLGRYGDRVDPLGWKLGLQNLSRLLQGGGRLFLATPLGTELVVFNAHRVFSPEKIIGAATDHGLTLDSMTWIAGGRLWHSKDLPGDVAALGQRDYSLGIFEFVKE